MAGLLILSIETSTGCGSVALTAGTIDDGRLVAEFTHRPDVTHSRRLLGSIRQAMSIGEITWDMLDAVAVSLGPGSFTGLRIGMAAAKGISLAANIPIIGIASPHGLAAQCIGTAKQVCCILDARKGQVYAAFYQPDQLRTGLSGLASGHGPDGSSDQSVCIDSSIMALTPEELVRMVTVPTLLVGPGITPYADIFSSHELMEIAPQALIQPRASMVGFLAAKKLQINGEQPVSGNDLRPLYVRASEAEINRQRKKNM